MQLTYYVFFLNEHKELELHPGFSAYGYYQKEDIFEIMKTSYPYSDLFIVERYYVIAEE